jgi:hypothetical protein
MNAVIASRAEAWLALFGLPFGRTKGNWVKPKAWGIKFFDRPPDQDRGDKEMIF